MTRNKARLAKCDELLAAASFWEKPSRRRADTRDEIGELAHWAVVGFDLDTMIMSEACAVGDLGPEDLA
jgi:hypothetical protein